MTSQTPDPTPEVPPQTPDPTPAVPPQTPLPETDPSEPSFGWTTYAEQLNGRFAMMGILLLLALEFFSNQTFFEWIGWR